MIRIADIDVLAVALPLVSPISMAGMTVTAAENLVVRITDKQGRTGWGEAASAPTMTGDFPAGMVAAGKFLAGRLLDNHITAASDIAELFQQKIYGNHGTRGAFEMALLDLLAQAQGVPLYEVLGGRQRRTAPVLVMVAGETASSELDHARAAASRGFKAFKVKVGVRSPEEDLGRCRQIREALGPDVQISADANQGYDRTEAMVFAREASAAGLDFMEQLLPGDDLHGMANCAAASETPLGADEGLHDLDDITAHARMRAASGGSLKPVKFGGLIPVMAAGRLMNSLDMRVNLAGKIAESSIASAAIAHLAVALPQLDWGVSVTSQYLSEDVTDKPLQVHGGKVQPPDGPGLGIRPDPAKLKSCRMRFHDM